SPGMPTTAPAGSTSSPSSPGAPCGYGRRRWRGSSPPFPPSRSSPREPRPPPPPPPPCPSPIPAPGRRPPPPPPHPPPVSATPPGRPGRAPAVHYRPRGGADWGTRPLAPPDLTDGDTPALLGELSTTLTNCQADLEYRVVAGAVESPVYQLKVLHPLVLKKV